MKSPMNCDRVFDILTRGPFPNGETTDAAVELHLIACHDCRRLAEALRPAINLFHEAVPCTELHNLPGYTGALCSRDGKFLSESKIVTLAPPLRRTLRLQQLLHLAFGSEYLMPRFALAMLIGATLFGILWSVTHEAPPHRPPHASASSWSPTPSAVPSIQPEGRQMLVALALPATCQHGLSRWLGHNHDSDSSVIDSIQNGSLKCCTDCHAAHRPPQVALSSLGKIVRSCQACHADEVTVRTQ